MTQHNTPQTNTIRQWLSQASRPLLIKMGLLFFGTIGAVFFLAWLIFGDGLAFTPTLEQPVSAADSVNFLSQPGLVNMQVDGLDLGVVQQLNPPKSIELNGFQLDVSNQYLSDETLLQPMELSANQIGWLENSIVNYIFRLPGSRSYRDLLEKAVAANSVVTLTTAQGNQLAFTVTNADARFVTAQDSSLQQKRPSITLLWTSEDEQSSYVVSGVYAPSPLDLQAVGFSGETAVDTPTTATTLAVHLDTADLQTNGLQLLVRGTLTNRGTEARIIEAKDINLAANGLVSQIISTDPPLPWQVPPNNSQMIFTVTFQRPPESEAVLSIDSQRFALSFTE